VWFFFGRKLQFQSQISQFQFHFFDPMSDINQWINQQLLVCHHWGSIGHYTTSVYTQVQDKDDEQSTIYRWHLWHIYLYIRTVWLICIHHFSDQDFNILLSHQLWRMTVPDSERMQSQKNYTSLEITSSFPQGEAQIIGGAGSHLRWSIVHL